jgi:hypothetical protein
VETLNHLVSVNPKAIEEIPLPVAGYWFNIQQALAADGGLACVSSNHLLRGLNAERAVEAVDGKI